MAHFEYVKAFVELPFAGNFSYEIEGEGLGESGEEHYSLDQLNQLWLGYLHQQFFIEVKQWSCIPAISMVHVLHALVAEQSVHLLLPTPFDNAELLAFSSNYSNVHLLHASAANHWKVSPDQLDNWCQNHEDLCSSTFVYLPKPISGVAWKSGELKRLAEVAKSNRITLVREASMYTLAEESFFHFLPNSALIYINPYSGFNQGDWQFGYLMQPKKMMAQFSELNKKLNNEFAPNQHAVEALNFWLKSSPIQQSLLAKWERLVKALLKEVKELLHASNLILSSGNQGIAILLDFENYRVAFGRKELYSIEAVCAELEIACGVKLLSGSKLGLAPNTLIAAMYLSNVDDLEWLENSEENIDGSFLYKHFWLCIEGAQKLMKYLNTLS